MWVRDYEDVVFGEADGTQVENISVKFKKVKKRGRGSKRDCEGKI